MILFFIYNYLIRILLNNNNNNAMSSNSPIISNFNVITDDILNTNINQLNNGIWYIIDKYKKNFGFLNNYYKEEYSIYNLYFALNIFL